MSHQGMVIGLEGQVLDDAAAKGETAVTLALSHLRLRSRSSADATGAPLDAGSRHEDKQAELYRRASHVARDQVLRNMTHASVLCNGRVVVGRGDHLWGLPGARPGVICMAGQACTHIVCERGARLWGQWMLGQSSGGTLCRADCRFLGAGSRLHGRGFCLCVAGGPWVIERCAVSASPLPAAVPTGDAGTGDVGSACGAVPADDKLRPGRWDHLESLLHTVRGQATGNALLHSLDQWSANTELLGGKPADAWGWGRCGEVVCMLVVCQAQLVVYRSELSGGVRLTDECDAMLEDCHVTDTGSRATPNVDGIAFDGSAVGLLRRCLFTNHSRAAVAVCGEGAIEAVVDTCEFAGNSGSILHADYNDEGVWRIRTDVNLKLLRCLIRDGLSLWRGDRCARQTPPGGWLALPRLLSLPAQFARLRTDALLPVATLRGQAACGTGS